MCQAYFTPEQFTPEQFTPEQFNELPRRPTPIPFDIDGQGELSEDEDGNLLIQL